MKRTMMILMVAALMMAMLAGSAVPAFADNRATVEGLTLGGKVLFGGGSDTKKSGPSGDFHCSHHGPPGGPTVC